MFKNMGDYATYTMEIVTVGGRMYKTEFPDKPHTVIFGLSFGLNHGQDSVNHALAQSVADVRTYLNTQIPAVVQDRMMPCLERLSVPDYYSVGKDSEYTKRLDSREILKLSMEKARALGVETDGVIYVAHPAHVQRVMDTGTKLGLRGIPFVSASVKWSNADAEEWVRSARTWVTREMLTRMLYKSKGYI